jgi:4-amino-4-deoxy-L-arabinose transferase-like glycosyltransferase
MAIDVAYPPATTAKRAGRSLLYQLAAALAILLFFFLALDSLMADSPTIDEQNHIARGLAFLRTGDPRLSLEHPPLINVLSALPLLTMPEMRLPTDHPSWERPEGWYEFADLFLWQYNAADVDRIVFLARLPIVLLALALGLAGFSFSRLMWGRPAALVALALFLFEPNLLAHGRYTTTDMGGILFTFVTTILLWRLWTAGRRWSWCGVLGVGLVMGAAFGSKLSALGFLPVWLLLAALPLYPSGENSDKASGVAQRGRGALRRIGQLATAAVVSVVVVWAIFGFQWGDYDVGGPLSFLTGARGPAPIYVAGVGQILTLTGGGGRPAFLLGQYSDSGFAGYFPVAFSVKTPIVLLILIAVAAVVLLYQRPTRARAMFLLVAAVAFFTLTMFSALNIGYRHALPALPYLLVLAAGLAHWQQGGVGASARALWGQPARTWIAVGGVAILLVTTLWIHPHYLSYFNRIGGGPQSGYKVLTDSNIDWGQDLIRLKAWMVANDVPAVNLAWFGTADPAHYDIAYTPLPGLGRDEFFRRWWDVPFNRLVPEPGVYAISVSNLAEMPLRLDEKTVFAWFRDHPPDARIGYSILIYDLR